MDATHVDVWLTWHTRRVNEAKAELATVTCPIKQAELISKVRWHEAAINTTNKSANRKARTPAGSNT